MKSNQSIYHSIHSKSTNMTDHKNPTNQPNSVVRMLDKFLQMYNSKYQKSGHIFEDLDPKDPSATNDKMELFYEYMQEHNDLTAKNPQYIDIYDPSDEIENADQYDIYALCKNDRPLYVSLSFISLLSYGVGDKKLGTDWKIVKL